MIKTKPHRHSGNWLIIVLVLGYAWMDHDSPTTPTNPVATTAPVVEIELESAD